jgi:hypothetical protein
MTLRPQGPVSLSLIGREESVLNARAGLHIRPYATATIRGFTQDLRLTQSAPYRCAREERRRCRGRGPSSAASRGFVAAKRWVRIPLLLSEALGLSTQSQSRSAPPKALTLGRGRAG